MTKTNKKRAKASTPPAPRETPEDFAARQARYAQTDAMIASGELKLPEPEPPPEEWIDAIRGGKPTEITTNTSGEFMAVCALAREGILAVGGFGQGKTNGQTIWRVYYPQPKQEELL